jgi:hypothetical protein
MSQSRTLDLKSDVHQESIAGAFVGIDHNAEVLDLGTIGAQPCDIAQLVRTQPSNAQPLVFVYEAGPSGRWLSRDLTQTGHVCWVVAPAVIPQTAGDRVKTDRRDAVQLARLRHSGGLTAGDVPALDTKGGLMVPESDVPKGFQVRCPRPSEEVQTQCGVTLDGVKRFIILAPRSGQAPDGYT